MKSKNNHFHPYHRQPKLCQGSLDFEFIRECMKINKIRPKFHFLTQKSDSNDSPCVFVFSIYSFFPFRAIWKPFNRLFSTQNRKFLFFVKKWNLGRFFSYILLLIQNLLDEQLPQSLGHLCCRQRLIHNDCISFFKLLEIFTRSQGSVDSLLYQTLHRTIISFFSWSLPGEHCSSSNITTCKVLHLWPSDMAMLGDYLLVNIQKFQGKNNTASQCKLKLINFYQKD